MGMGMGMGVGFGLALALLPISSDSNAETDVTYLRCDLMQKGTVGSSSTSGPVSYFSRISHSIQIITNVSIFKEAIWEIHGFPIKFTITKDYYLMKNIAGGDTVINRKTGRIKSHVFKDDQYNLYSEGWCVKLISDPLSIKGENKF